MENNKNDRNEESLESTFDMLLSDYQEVSEALNETRDERKKLEDKQRELEVYLSLTKSEFSALKNRLVDLNKINRSSVVNNKYIKKIRDLNEIGECCLERLRNPYIEPPYTSSKVINRLLEKNFSFLEFFERKDDLTLLLLWTILILGATGASLLVLCLSGGPLLLSVAVIFAGTLSPIIWEAVSYAIKKTTAPSTSTEVLQKIGKILDKISKKQNKYKKKLEKKYGVPYEEIERSYIEGTKQKKEHISKKLQEIEHNMNKLNDEITGNNEKLQEIRAKETAFAKITDYIEGKLGFKIIPGMAEEETAEEYVVEDTPKQYRKTKKKGVGNNGK